MRSYAEEKGRGNKGTGRGEGMRVDRWMDE